MTKGKTRVLVRSQKQESFYMCILVLCDGSCKGKIICIDSRRSSENASYHAEKMLTVVCRSMPYKCTPDMTFCCLAKARTTLFLKNVTSLPLNPLHDKLNDLARDAVMLLYVTLLAVNHTLIFQLSP